MLQLVYISTAREEPLAQDLSEILRVSRENNAAVDVTGLLVSGGRRFLQVLEGPEAAVLKTFARLAADPRHFAIVRLSQREIAERQFGNWAMAYNAGGDAGDGDDLRHVVRTLLGPVTDREIRAQFTGFAEIHSRAA